MKPVTGSAGKTVPIFVRAIYEQQISGLSFICFGFVWQRHVVGAAFISEAAKF